MYQGPSPTTDGASPQQDPWLKLAKDAFDRSTTYFDNNYRKQIEDGLRMFQSKHPKNSKYNSDSFKYRSRLFRPKSRSMVRRHEATASLAFFSSPDVIGLDPTNPDDPMQVASSVIMKELLQYRLTKTIPWYLTVLGGIQDAMTVGVVASFQYWKYTTRKESQQQMGMHPQFGQVMFDQEVDVPVDDRPEVQLIAIENLHFDPAASWSDVIGTSPYVILEIPMYIRDVLELMETMQWNPLDMNVLLEARLDTNLVRNARNDNKEDPKQISSDFNEFDVVQTRLNFVKVGQDVYTYYTLKDTHLLSEPALLDQVFLHGEIPITVGFCVIETHKSLPASLLSLGADLQQEANEIVNQRLDNVKLVLNKRWFVRRSANADVDSMLRNVPGGVTMLNDVDKDVREVNWQDVTSSAYAEQDRVNVDYDELLGSFAQSSVMTNRRLNETVGGMKMMAQGANLVTEYTIRVFVETWVEPTLRQLVKLEQFYETDEVLLALAAQKAQLFQRFGMNKITDRLLKQDLTLTVNVGMGATDPDTRFQRFMQALAAYAQLSASGPQDLILPELRKELFSLAGFKDSARFFGPVDPRLLQAQQMLQQAQAMAQEVIDKGKDRIMKRERQLDKKDTDLNIRSIEMDLEEGARKTSEDIMDRLEVIQGGRQQSK